MDGTSGEPCKEEAASGTEAAVALKPPPPPPAAAAALTDTCKPCNPSPFLNSWYGSPPLRPRKTSIFSCLCLFICNPGLLVRHQISTDLKAQNLEAKDSCARFKSRRFVGDEAEALFYVIITLGFMKHMLPGAMQLGSEGREETWKPREKNHACFSMITCSGNECEEEEDTYYCTMWEWHKALQSFHILV